MRRSSDNVVDDVAENMQPVVGESSSQPLITNADADDVMHSLELTHEFKKARIGADKVRKATPLSRRLCTLKNGKSLGSVAIIPRGHASVPDHVNKDASVLSTTHKGAPARATTSDLNSTLSSPAPARRQHDIAKHTLRARDIAEESSVVGHTTKGGQHSISLDSYHAVGHNLALHAFQRAVHEETNPVPHEGLEKLIFDSGTTPICECGDACTLMYCLDKDGDYAATPVEEHHTLDPHAEGVTYLWVCSAGACMFYDIASFHGGDARAVFAARNAASDEHSQFALSDGHAIESHDLVHSTAPQLLNQTPENFWALVSKDITRLDPEIGNLSIHRSRCNCDLNCNIAICNVSGDLFWICPAQTCIFVAHLERRPDNVDNWNGYVGVITPLGEADIDRFTNLAYLQKNFAQCLTLDFMTKLSKSGADADFPKGSFELEKGMNYHAFLSYRGATGRLALYLSLVGEFNFLYAFLFVFLIAPCIVAGLSFIPDPCTNGWPIWMMGADGCLHNPDTGERYQGYSWLLWKTWSTPIVLIIIWCGPIIWSWRSYYRIFLDKFCIHQGSSIKNGQGLLRLPLYLQNSRSLYCLFDEGWIHRLWCVWELAVYLRVCPNPRVIFSSISQRYVEVIAVSSALFLHWLKDLVDAIYFVPKWYEDDDATNWYAKIGLQQMTWANWNTQNGKYGSVRFLFLSVFFVLLLL